MYIVGKKKMICTRQRFAYVSLRNVFRVSPRFNWLRSCLWHSSDI